MRKIKLKKNKPLIWIVIFFLLLGSILFSFIRLATRSVIFLKKDRLNMVFYGQQSMFVSLGLTDGVHYLIPYPHDLSFTVPGGYGEYKVGSLGKLAELEKKPDLIQRAFSYSTSSMVDFYFYPKKVQVYSDLEVSGEKEKIPRLTTMLLFNSRSNASLFERLFLFFLMIGKRKNDFDELNMYELSQEKYQGYFYQKSFRTEGKKVSFLYTQYSTVLRLSHLFEGEGIRVVDLSPQTKKEGCIIKDAFDHDKVSLTSRYLAHIFSCPVMRKSKKDMINSDIVVILDKRVENEWE